LGAVSIGKDLQRNAVQQIIYAKFIQQWAVAYNEYYARFGAVVGDDGVRPSLKVGNDSETTVCGPTLHDLMDAVGIEMPPGRAEGEEDRYVYLDSNGNPMELRVCFSNIPWQGSVNNKNVMVIMGLNPDLARNLDATIDGQADPEVGLFRQAVEGGTQIGVAVDDPDNSISGVTQWTINNRRSFAGVDTDEDEQQVEVVTAVYRMNQ
jgi:hypothetical protein